MDGVDCGSAYVFHHGSNGASGWTEGVRIAASDGSASDLFGESVGIHGNLALVGAPYDDDNSSSSGSAYVFRFDGKMWIEEAKLTASDGTEHDNFGTSVHVFGDVALVGAPLDAPLAPYSGSAYVFRHDGSSWVEQAKLVPSDGEIFDQFGTSMAVSGDTAIVAAAHHDGEAYDSGAVYVFRFDGMAWVQEAKLTQPDAPNAAFFGQSVAISGDTVLAATARDAANGSYSSAVFVFRFNGVDWINEARLVPSGGTSCASFGSSVGVSDGIALVGAAGDDDIAGNSGALYVFRFEGDTWVEVAKLKASNGEANDHLGSNVAMDGDSAISGMKFGYSRKSTARMFHGLSDCNENGTLDICDLADGDNEDCNENGIPDECDIASGVSEDVDGNGMPDECAYYYTAQETAILFAADGEASDSFGRSLDVSGDKLLVGAPADSENGVKSGSAYVFHRDPDVPAGWIEEEKLSASDGSADDYFGGSVAIAGDIALVGALRDSDNGDESGSAYIFRFDGSSWTEEAKLSPPYGISEAWFGASTALLTGPPLRALVGAPGAGSVHVFRQDGVKWAMEAQLTASDEAAGSWFGISMAASGENVLIGARRGVSNGHHSGVAYVFHLEGSAWEEVAKLAPSDGAANVWLVPSVAISGNTVLVGPEQGRHTCSRPDSVCLFRFDQDQWIEDLKLTARDIGAGGLLSPSVALSGDTSLVGACWCNGNENRSGSAYLFPSSGDVSRTIIKLTASNGAEDDMFGYAVAATDDVAFVGAFNRDDGAGAVYVFRGLATDCNENDTLDICDVMDGGDFEADEDVDLLDYTAMTDCLSGPGTAVEPTAPECDHACLEAFDFDNDGDVDLTDLAAFQCAFAGSD